ncbi:hypothetical protein GGH94_003761 [Coemansia aciculifera]|uniref:Phosphatidic acid phosphatase type 2/haloperoxidase domain-containing protein n=1 Tax=Coemansia aciculifera TaxID=417176 RepID=A0A9W8IQJ5_9FUNG|nr:hypothetical protein GGH94_003761 [Coemansia aciculifera]KAJ2872975.1 hypothetical protein GGH93_003602 [Coemansia aciculifera]
MFGFDVENRRSGEPRSRRARLLLSYVPDYAVVVAMAVLWGLLSNIEPFHREFSLTNKSIQYPHKDDSVPFYAAVLLCFAFPLVVILLWTSVIRRSFHDMNSGVLGLCLSLVLNMMITNTIKNLAGRHRPDFITRCNLDTENASTLEPFIGLLNTSICRQTDKHLFWDGMRSFPSGHTSFAFAGFTYLSLWLGGHMHIGDRRGRAYKSFVALVPLLTAMLIGVSRTKDYRHHWQDVLAGAILGVFMGWFGYHQYYPSPFDNSEDTSIPYPPRIPEDEPTIAQPSFGLKSFARVTGDGNEGGVPVGSNSGSGTSPRGAAADMAVGEQPRYLAHMNTSTGSVYSQQYGSQVGPRTPAQAHAIGNSREALVNPYGAH